MTDTVTLPPVAPAPRSPRTPRVTTTDLLLILAIAAMALAVLVGFGWFLHTQGFIAYPDVAQQQARGDMARYFQDALDYRERRLALALILRTFITGFAFVVGLALCTQGGIFILRQVTAFTQIKAQVGGATGTNAAPLFSFASYSPGVAFLLGGVAVMVATQYLAIPIIWVEIVPPSAVQLCQSDDGKTWVSCFVHGAERTFQPVVRPQANANACLEVDGKTRCQPPR